VPSIFWGGPIRWQKLSAAGKWADLPGQTNLTLHLPSVSLGDAGRYRFVSFCFCEHFSEPAALKVNALPPVPEPGTVDPAFYVIAIEGASSLPSPDWEPIATICPSEKNDIPIPSGQKQSFYRARAVQ